MSSVSRYQKCRDARGRVRIDHRDRHDRGEGHHGDLAIAVALRLFAQGLARV